MYFKSMSEAKSKILYSLHENRLMVSDVEISPSKHSTACINLVTKKITIGWGFLLNSIRTIDDIKFLIQHEVTHRFITNQWNKMRLIDDIKKNKPYDISGYVDIDWEIISIIEDAFINNYIRNALLVTSNFPEYYYTEKNDTNIWLCTTWDFNDYKKNSLLSQIRNNNIFLIDLYTMSSIYWILWKEKEAFGGYDEPEEGEGGEGGEDGDSTDDSGTPSPITSVSSTDGGKDIGSSGNQDSVVEEQAQQEKESKKVSGYSHPRGRLNKKYVPNINKDMEFADLFDMKTADMQKFESLTEGKKTLVHFLEGIVETARQLGPNHYDATNVPSVISRHDRAMIGLGQAPQYFQHRIPEEGLGEAKWNIYLDVSASMETEVPLGRHVASKLSHLTNKLYMFSSNGKPLEYDGGSYVYTSGGTWMRECFDHCSESGINHMILIGDGEDEYVKGMNLRTRRWADDAETIMIIVGDSNEYWVDEARRIFKYTYILNEDKILERFKKGAGR